MTIGEYIKLTDIETYKKLKRLFKTKVDKPKKDIKLGGDSVVNLMKADSYCRSGRRIKQRGGWGG